MAWGEGRTDVRVGSEPAVSWGVERAVSIIFSVGSKLLSCSSSLFFFLAFF